MLQGCVRQAWASRRRRDILEHRLLAVGLGRSRKVGADGKSWGAGCRVYDAKLGKSRQVGGDRKP